MPHKLICKNQHVSDSLTNGGCPVCGDESFQIVFETEKAEPLPPAVSSPDGSVIAIHSTRGTGYIAVEPGHGGMATVTTEGGSKYTVRSECIEYLGR